MKKIFLFFILSILFVSCQKDPKLSKLDDDFVVFTNYDKEVNFSSFSTFYIPDSILMITEKGKAEYWKDAEALKIINTFVNNMTVAGYTRETEKTDANLGLQVSYVKNINYFLNYDSPYWWWGYPEYWGPGYWGGWGGWYYPYTTVYSYSVGSLLVEMVNLDAPESGTNKLPIVWSAYMTGLLSNSSSFNMQLTTQAVNQAFVQSPYIKK